MLLPNDFVARILSKPCGAMNVSLFAVDEAHCISQWGHDFSPTSCACATIAEFGRPQIVALTATATPYVRADIIEQLDLNDPRAFVSGFDRPNLSIKVVQTQKDARRSLTSKLWPQRRRLWHHLHFDAQGRRTSDDAA